MFILKPRWSDLDAYHHVNNVTWLEYLQEARVDMLFVHAPGSAGPRAWPRACSSSGPRSTTGGRWCSGRSPYPIEMWVSKIGGASFTISYEIADPDDGGGRRVLYGRASTVLAPVDLQTGHPRRLTEIERDVLGRFLDESAH